MDKRKHPPPLTCEASHKQQPSVVHHITNTISFVFSFEVIFTLFLFSGRFKADSRFAWVPVDITGLFFGLSVCIAIYLISIRRVRLKKHALLISCITLSFIVWLIVSLAWTPSLVYAKQKAFYVATLTLWSLLGAAVVIASSIHRIKRFFLAIILFSIWVMVESCFIYFNGGGNGTIRALGGNYLSTGYTCGMGGLIILGYVVFDRMNIHKKIMLMSLISLHFFVMLVGGGRGPLIMMIFAAMVPLFLAVRFSNTKSIRVKKYLFPFMGIVVMVIMLLGYLLLNNQVNMTTIHRISVLFRPGLGASGGVRYTMLLNSLSLFINNPLFGYGVGSYPILTGCIDSRIYPHNIFLEIMVEMGLVGLVLFISLLFVGIRSLGSSRILRNNSIRIIILMLFAFTLGGALISGDLHDNRLLFMVIGLMASQKSIVKEQSNIATLKNRQMVKQVLHRTIE
ncbi:MAG: O-antigen ligase family protein [Clostridiales bacterium]|nr:O-antigen ligase family protein [Clostridiales bacterium]